MRRTALPFVVVAATLLGAAGVASASSPRSSSSTRQLDAGSESAPGLLSLPQHAPDPGARARSLASNGSSWEFVPYSQTPAGSAASDLTMAAPGGRLGSAQLQAETATIRSQVSASSEAGQQRLRAPIVAKCNQIGGGGGNCFGGLDSYVALYEALDPEYQPAAFRFWDSDSAFARDRISSSPAFLKRVTDLAEVPFAEADVVGYDAITGGGATLAQLLAQERLFVVDFMPLQRQGLLTPAPNAFVEVPTAVFFLADSTVWADSTAGTTRAAGGPNLRGTNGTSTAASAASFAAAATNDNDDGGSAPQQMRLMPLAIKFNVFNQNVYSPKDAHADWFLAKAAFNALDRDVNAIYHFALHTAIANIAIAANKHLAQAHPLFRPILRAASKNFGIIANGIAGLLAPGTGLFNAYLSLDGPAIQRRLFPHFMRTFDWEANFLATDLAARGVADVPGFLYRDDAAALYDSLHAFVSQYLEPFYQTASDVEGDTELVAFLAPLSNATGAYTPSNLAYLKGFPSPAQMRTPEDVTRMLTQILWIVGAQHHALNSFRIFHYDLVYPNHPGKILSAPPTQKGQLTDEDVMARYIAGRRLMAGRQRVPMSPAARLWMGNLTVLGEILGNAAAGPNAGASALDFFVGTQIFAFDFFPLLRDGDRLTNAYQADGAAGAQLRTRLLDLSERIRAREAATAKDAPAYTLLDPTQLPFYLYI